ncbi:MAG TPA: hypothetical protein DCX14_12000 [Flavobacteriales bacterium]|jgi:hypothetical protein|nr:DUF4199 domain-containing protein [Flavobacteriales bacterium]HAW20897.1 hypothetical protein [Flavobacteriales bacterium]
MKRYQSILNAGSIAGLLSYGSFLVLYYLLSFNPLGPGKLVAFIGVGVLMYFALKRHLDMELEGFATFRQLLTPALIFSFVFASLNGMLIYLHGAFVDAGFVELVVNDSLESIGPYKDEMINFMGKADYKKMLEEYQNLTFSEVALTDAQSKSFSSILLGLIFALTMRKNPPIFDDSEH